MANSEKASLGSLVDTLDTTLDNRINFEMQLMIHWEVDGSKMD